MKYEYKICKLGVLFGIFGTMNTFIPSPAPKLKVAEKVLPKVVRIFQQTFEFLRWKIHSKSGGPESIEIRSVEKISHYVSLHQKLILLIYCMPFFTEELINNH